MKIGQTVSEEFGDIRITLEEHCFCLVEDLNNFTDSKVDDRHKHKLINHAIIFYSLFRLKFKMIENVSYQLLRKYITIVC